jgi:uncharacterized membrane protein YphA (DoxX/SURF4 family)
MYSMFPDGWPGAGLLLLRAAAGTVLLAQGIAYLYDKREAGLFAVAVAAAMSLVGASLLVGFLTRLVGVVALVAFLGSAFPWLRAPDAGPLATSITAGLSAVISVAVVCLGPGAFSLDARLFGRREIVIPPSSPEE